MTQGQPVERKEPWVKVSIKHNGEVTVTGEGWNNTIEIITALSTAVGVLQQQIANTARIMVPGVPPRIGPMGRS